MKDSTDDIQMFPLVHIPGPRPAKLYYIEDDVYMIPIQFLGGCSKASGKLLKKENDYA